MRLKVESTEAIAQHADGPAVGVGWLNAESLLSVGDDRQLLQWTVGKAEPQAMSNFKTASFPTTMHSLIHQVGGKATNLFIVGFSDGKAAILNAVGKIEKTVEAHSGATLSVKWSNDATGFLSTGEDGSIKMWSRSGMLRSVLAQYGRPVYAADWNADGSRVVYCTGEHCYIKLLKAHWKAHESVVTCLCWSAAVDQIVTGGEDCRYRVWDTFGRSLYASNPHSYPITSVAWNPEGELFAVGSFNVLRLCDKAGWSHSVDRQNIGSIYQLAWSPDSTQVAAATASGRVLLAQVIDKRMWWHNLDAVQTQNKTIDLRDVLSDVSKERLEMRDRVTRLQLGYEHLVVATTKQCYIFSSKNWNTPIILDLKEGAVSLIVLCEKYFLLVDSGSPLVYNYDGRLQCVLRPAGGAHAAAPPSAQSEAFTQQTVGLSNDVVVIRDRQQHNTLDLYETKTGKVAGDGRLVHGVDIVEVAINQCGPLAERRIAFVDINGECFIGLINTYGAMRRCEKIGAMISNIHFNNNTNMLAAFRERKVIVWALPTVVFTDRDLLPKVIIDLDSGDMGKSSFIIGFIGNGVAVRRSDGCMILSYAPPFLTGLIRAVGDNHWDRALRLCRTLKEDYTWATLAGMAAMQNNYNIAEIAYGELLDVEKVWFLNEIRDESKPEMKAAHMSLFNGNIREAETNLAKSGRIFRAIMLNIEMFRFDKALDLAVKHRMHVDTVLGFRGRFLEQTGRREEDARFLKQLASVEVDWPHIREKIQADAERDEKIK
ncbi:Intraflagellar transport protein 80-like protein [Aphelenchoides fujianensis]|nr:Intraflagellar transport protein 80-like protein [Aphelenchoides fujianensis]KAI6230636.1 Intraflagellar transport protein 80-like protein [Aphelenchoides fujianensis]